MIESNTAYAPDPAAETDYVLKGFWRCLASLAHPSSHLDIVKMEARAAELEREHAAAAGDEPSRYNLRYACAVLAGFEALSRTLSQEPAVSLLREAFSKSGAFVREKTRAWLDTAPDPFRELVAISKTREASQFGPSFQFERLRDDDGAYLLNVRKCFWHDLFVSVGKADLTRVLCEFDANWIAAIDPERHGLRFERTSTLGYGASHCPFHFVRLRPPAPGKAGAASSPATSVNNWGEKE
jgi:hypothetical protein